MMEQQPLAAFEPDGAAYDWAKASQALAVKVAPLDADVPKMLEEWLRAGRGRGQA